MLTRTQRFYLSFETKIMSDKIEKIRRLLSDPIEGEVVLQDTINALVEMSQDLAKLEINNNVAACSRSIKRTIEIEKLLKNFKARLKEVKVEAMAANAFKGPKHTGTPDNLPNIN